MQSSMTSALDLELRKLSSSHINNLSTIFMLNDCWKELMSHIPKQEVFTSGHDSDEKKFTLEHIRLIENEAKFGSRTPFVIFLDEWGTMGRKRPTVKTLFILCLELDNFRAASYINQEILARDIVTQEQKNEILNQLVANDSVDFTDIENRLEELSLELERHGSISSIFQSGLQVEANTDIFEEPIAPENTLNIPKVPLSYLKDITEGFGVKDPSRKIGSGGFADVFLGISKRSNREFAVKRLKKNDNDLSRLSEQFNNEVVESARLKHRFIIEILGYSNECAENLCLIYPFYKNGTLERRLQSSDSTLSLDSSQRLNIILGVAEGIHYLHTRHKKLIHRDIKSSNILLDDNLSPKIADFGLLRFASTNDTETVNIKGTLQYMAPEAARGCLTTKIDVYSYGVFLLEVITGLRPLFLLEDGEKQDLVTHVETTLAENDLQGSLEVLQDRKIRWPQTLVENLFEIALDCLKEHIQRPSIDKVIEKLKTWPEAANFKFQSVEDWKNY